MDELMTRIDRMSETRRNSLVRRRSWVKIFSSFSPAGALGFVSTDLARTGFYHQGLVQRAMDGFLHYYADYVWVREPKFWGMDPNETLDLYDFVPLAYRHSDTTAEALARNLPQIINLLVLVVIGFTGAWISLLRYDVR